MMETLISPMSLKTIVNDLVAVSCPQTQVTADGLDLLSSVYCIDGFMLSRTCDNENRSSENYSSVKVQHTMLKSRDAMLL